MTPIDAGGNDVAVSEVSCPDPRDVYRAVEDRGRRRTEALTAAADHLDDAVGLVRDALERGAVLNLAECARCAGVTKATLYARLPRDLVAGRTHTRSMADPPPEALQDPTTASHGKGQDT